ASPTVGASPTPALTYDALLGLSSASAVSSFLPVLPAGSQQPRRLHRPFPISTPAGCTSPLANRHLKQTPEPAGALLRGPVDARSATISTTQHRQIRV